MIAVGLFVIALLTDDIRALPGIGWEPAPPAYESIAS